jgi:RNA ligase
MGSAMGSSHGEFVKYPRTPHLFGSKGTDDDKHLSEADSHRFLADGSLIVEEKLDGTNVGIHFTDGGDMVLQCRGHLITDGMHPQYDLFKQWGAVKRSVLEDMLADQFILFGEWVYARHSVYYRQLPHYFFEFDIYDKHGAEFLSLERRLAILEGTGIQTVPVIHVGALARQKLGALIGPSHFDSVFENPFTHCTEWLLRSALPVCQRPRPLSILPAGATEPALRAIRALSLHRDSDVGSARQRHGRLAGGKSPRPSRRFAG